MRSFQFILIPLIAFQLSGCITVTSLLPVITHMSLGMFETEEEKPTGKISVAELLAQARGEEVIEQPPNTSLFTYANGLSEGGIKEVVIKVTLSSEPLGRIIQSSMEEAGIKARIEIDEALKGNQIEILKIKASGSGNA